MKYYNLIPAIVPNAEIHVNAPKKHYIGIIALHGYLIALHG
jgi:hypothetical protein